MTAAGKLWGVGLGPGDPELVTLKAARLVSGARILAYPTLAGSESFARRIVAGLIAPGTEEIVIPLPMSPDPVPAQAAYDAGAERIAAALASGREVVAICEGDPLFYGSFMYLFARLAPRFAVEVVPGVSAIMAGAARAGLPLVARNDSLMVVPGPLDDAALARHLAAAPALAILKVGRHLPRIRQAIAAAGLLDRAVYVAHASLPQEVVLPLAEAPEAAPYFSMILVAGGVTR